MRRTRLHIVLIAAAGVLAAVCFPARAGYSRGGRFTAPGYGARAWGMGGAAVAWGADEGATYWNPALLSLVDKGRIGFSYVNLVPGTEARHSYVAYARSIEEGALDAPGLEFSEHAIGVLYGNLAARALRRPEIHGKRAHARVRVLRPSTSFRSARAWGFFSRRATSANSTPRGPLVTVGIRVVMLERVTLGARGAESLLARDVRHRGGLQPRPIAHSRGGVRVPRRRVARGRHRQRVRRDRPGGSRLRRASLLRRARAPRRDDERDRRRGPDAPPHRSSVSVSGGSISTTTRTSTRTRRSTTRTVSLWP